MGKTTLLALALMLSIVLCNAQKTSVKEIEEFGISSSKSQRVYAIIDSTNISLQKSKGDKEKQIEARKAQDNQIKLLLTPEEFIKYLKLKQAIHDRWVKEHTK